MSRIKDIILKNTQKGFEILTEQTRLLIYKSDPALFDLLDYEDNYIFLEPMLFAYFNEEKPQITLRQILFGYIEEKKRPATIEVFVDSSGRIYLPNLAWLHTSLSNERIQLSGSSLANISLNKHEKQIDFRIEPLNLIAETSIELVQYPVQELLSKITDNREKLNEIEIERISKQQKNSLTKAFSLIKKTHPFQFELIETLCPKVVVFNTDFNVRNSFASISAQGVGFFNSYQADYNEIFFIEDIAHQSGHVIFFATTFNTSEFLGEHTQTILKGDHRQLQVVYHALYTYYCILSCFDSILDQNLIDGKKAIEAFGRIGYVLQKCTVDEQIMGKRDETSNEYLYLTSKGAELYEEFIAYYNIIREKYYPKIKKYQYHNQPYNFTFYNFIKINSEIIKEQFDIELNP